MGRYYSCEIPVGHWQGHWYSQVFPDTHRGLIYAVSTSERLSLILNLENDSMFISISDIRKGDRINYIKNGVVIKIQFNLEDKTENEVLLNYTTKDGDKGRIFMERKTRRDDIRRIESNFPVI
jgi:hypothetical protein